MESNYSTNVKSYEQLTEAKIKFGIYQKRIMIILSLIVIADGIELTALSIILPILKVEFQISETLQSSLGFILFFGMFVGSLAAGLFIDKIGRRKALLFLSFSQFVLGIISVLITNVHMFLVIRAIFGFFLGFLVPLTPAILTELLPLEVRGRYTILVNSMFSVGQVLASIISYFCLSSLSTGNWRLMLFICSLPCLSVFILCYFYMKESAMHIILNGNIEKGMDILNEILIINKEYAANYSDKNFENNNFELICEGKNYNLKNQDESSCNGIIIYNTSDPNSLRNTNTSFFKNKQQNLNNKDIEKFTIEYDYLDFKNWREHVNSNNKLEVLNTFDSAKAIVANSKIRAITFSLWGSWFGINYIIYGLTFMLPFFFSEMDKYNASIDLNNSHVSSSSGLRNIIVTTFGELCSVVFAYFMVDSKTFGRKYTIILGLFVSSITCFLVFFIGFKSNNILLVFLIFNSRLFSKLSIAVLFSLTAEIYPTKIRTTGLGLSSAIGRVSAMIMPFISLKLFYNNFDLPFLSFSLIALLGLFSAIMIPYDTVGKPLDMINTEDENETKANVSNKFSYFNFNKDLIKRII